MCTKKVRDLGATHITMLFQDHCMHKLQRGPHVESSSSGWRVNSNCVGICRYGMEESMLKRELMAGAAVDKTGISISL